MEYIKFKKIDKGYLIKKTGKVVTKEQLKGLRNRPGIDEFEHLGYVYTEQMGKGRTIKETETDVIIELDITREEAEKIVTQEPVLALKILNILEVGVLFSISKPDSGVSN